MLPSPKMNAELLPPSSSSSCLRTRTWTWQGKAAIQRPPPASKRQCEASPVPLFLSCSLPSFFPDSLARITHSPNAAVVLDASTEITRNDDGICQIVTPIHSLSRYLTLGEKHVTCPCLATYSTNNASQFSVYSTYIFPILPIPSLL